MLTLACTSLPANPLESPCSSPCHPLPSPLLPPPAPPLQLLQALPQLPALSTLLLADPPEPQPSPGSHHQPTPWRVHVTLPELKSLARIPHLSALECPRIEGVRWGNPEALEPGLELPGLTHLGVEVLDLGRPLPAVLPGLTSLAVGRCPRLQAMRQPVLGGGAAGPSIVAAAATPTPPVAAAGGAGVGGHAGAAAGAGQAFGNGGVAAVAALLNGNAAAAAAAQANGHAAAAAGAGAGALAGLNLHGQVDAILAAVGALDAHDPHHRLTRVEEVARLQHLRRLDLCGPSATEAAQSWARSSRELSASSSLRCVELVGSRQGMRHGVSCTGASAEVGGVQCSACVANPPVSTHECSPHFSACVPAQVAACVERGCMGGPVPAGTAGSQAGLRDGGGAAPLWRRGQGHAWWPRAKGRPAAAGVRAHPDAAGEVEGERGGGTLLQ